MGFERGLIHDTLSVSTFLHETAHGSILFSIAKTKRVDKDYNIYIRYYSMFRISSIYICFQICDLVPPYEITGCLKYNNETHDSR